MKIVVFDVGNAACALAVCPSGHSIMVDCGSHPEKLCPVDWISGNLNTLGMRSHNGYKLTLLHVTHPDDDHVRNAEKLVEKLEPYLVHRRRHEHFSPDEHIHEGYKERIDMKYRGNPVSFNFGFSQNETFRIPVDDIKNTPQLSSKEKNNSSILRFIECGGVKVLFGGDLEKDGWDWLARNDEKFVNTMRNGLDVLIAPHHGHKSGFPGSLFELTGDVRAVIHSKGGEESIEGTDVASQYSDCATGVNYTASSGGEYSGKVLTTRSNGTIIMQASGGGRLDIFALTSSPNHTPISTLPYVL